MTEKPLAFLSLIKLLETAVGHKTKYGQLEPFRCTTMEDGKPAVLPIQQACQKIARHVGISEFTFVLSVTSQNPSTAGHIELRYGSPEVFVEISRDICPYKDAVLATLSHEVCHKFLHFNGIRHGSVQVEQEFLTDVTAVYLGLGKIMLNGCESQHSYAKTEAGRKITTTHTLRTGYISRECFAFVYRLICEMRRIPEHQYLSGLTQAALDALASCEQEHWKWFLPEYHTPEGFDKTSKDLQKQVMDRKRDAAAHDWSMRRARENLEALDVRLHVAHKPLFSADRKIADLLKPQNNSHLRYLNCIEARECVADLMDDHRIQMDALQDNLVQINELARQSENATPNSEIVQCPMDCTKLRVPAGRKQLLVTCPSCKYQFVVSTAAEDHAHVSANQRRNSGLLNSLKAAFGRR